MIETNPKYKGMIPGLFTMGNVVCGFISIMSAFEGNVTTACWFIILGAFLDVLDGKVARFSGGASQFGIELDSLADFLTFAVSPATLVFTIKLNSLGKWGWVISLIFIMAAAYRLARFNILASTEEKKEFLGLPVPAAALTLVTYIIFSYHLWDSLQYSELLVSMIILFSFLMVSQVQYETFPDKVEDRESRIKFILSLISIVVILFKPRLLLFPILSLYILFGMIREIVRLLSKGVIKVSSITATKEDDRKVK